MHALNLPLFDSNFYKQSANFYRYEQRITRYRARRSR